MQGGGERVMKAISKALKAKIYTIHKTVDDEEIVEIGSEFDKVIAKVEPQFEPK